MDATEFKDFDKVEESEPDHDVSMQAASHIEGFGDNETDGKMRSLLESAQNPSADVTGDGYDEPDGIKLPKRRKISLLESVRNPLANVTGDGYDETDGPFQVLKWKKRSLLESVQNPPVNVTDMEKSLTTYKDDPNEVDKTGFGFGPIHYLITEKHANRKELLICLAMYSRADLDLTTTELREVTALHLACKADDHVSVEILISLGADVNKRDKFGSTPLDYAQWRVNNPSLGMDVPMRDLDRGETVIVAGKDAKNSGLDETTEITRSQAYSMKVVVDRLKDSKILEMLRDVGAVSGDDVQKRDQSSSLQKRANIDCRSWKTMEDEVNALLKIETPTPEDAMKVVQLLKDQRKYRNVCGSRILCLDGGGIRGLVQMCILQEIERRTGKRVTELFDWIVGTSTGGIIALALTYGKSGPSYKSLLEIRNDYWQKKDQIFGSSPDGLLGFFGRGNTQELEAVVKSWLGEDIRLNDVVKPSVLIPAVEKSETDLKLHFFNNCFDNKYSTELVWKVARYTSAAPFYFTEFENYIDGGLLANNPSSEALTEIQRHFRDKGQKLPISFVLSIGSGTNPPKEIGKINVQKSTLNPKTWMNFFDVVGSALLNKGADENCRSRCEEQGISYFRFNPQLDDAVDSDQKKEKKLLKMLFNTRAYLATQIEQMDSLIELLEQSGLESPMHASSDIK